jgi:hypothetical protein
MTIGAYSLNIRIWHKLGISQRDQLSIVCDDLFYLRSAECPLSQYDSLLDFIPDGLWENEAADSCCTKGESSLVQAPG